MEKLSKTSLTQEQAKELLKRGGKVVLKYGGRALVLGKIAYRIVNPFSAYAFGVGPPGGSDGPIGPPSPSVQHDGGQGETQQQASTGNLRVFCETAGRNVWARNCLCTRPPVQPPAENQITATEPTAPAPQPQPRLTPAGPSALERALERDRLAAEAARLERERLEGELREAQAKLQRIADERAKQERKEQARIDREQRESERQAREEELRQTVEQVARQELPAPPRRQFPPRTILPVQEPPPLEQEPSPEPECNENLWRVVAETAQAHSEQANQKLLAKKGKYNDARQQITELETKRASVPESRVSLGAWARRNAGKLISGSLIVVVGTIAFFVGRKTKKCPPITMTP